MNDSRSALIVASYEYEDLGLRRLRAPAHDAEALARVLRDPEIGGFDVRTMLNEPGHVIGEAVEGFFDDRRPDELLLLHFSCHGIKDAGGALYFAASNTKLRRLGATAVAADFVNRCMSRSRSRRVVLLLDCCYAGAFERGMVARAGTAVSIEEQFGGRGRVVLTASSAVEYAFEGDVLNDSQAAKPSLFTSALVEGLETGDADRDQDGHISLDELYDYVHDKVRETTSNQTPGKWTFGVQGELHIARRRHPIVAPAELPPELYQAIDSPLTAVRTGAVQEAARLLHGRHAGRALAAKLALERLSADDSRTVAAAASLALRAGPPLVAGPERPSLDAPAAEIVPPSPDVMSPDAAPAASAPTASDPARGLQGRSAAVAKAVALPALGLIAFAGLLGYVTPIFSLVAAAVGLGVGLAARLVQRGAGHRTMEDLVAGPVGALVGMLLVSIFVPDALVLAFLFAIIGAATMVWIVRRRAGTQLPR